MFIRQIKNCLYKCKVVGFNKICCISFCLRKFLRMKMSKKWLKHWIAIVIIVIQFDPTLSSTNSSTADDDEWTDRTYPIVRIKVRDKEYSLQSLAYSSEAPRWSSKEYAARDICKTTKALFGHPFSREALHLFYTAPESLITTEEANNVCAAAKYLREHGFVALAEGVINRRTETGNETTALIVVMDLYLHTFKHDITYLRDNFFQMIYHNYLKFLSNKLLVKYDLADLETVLFQLYQRQNDEKMKKAILECFYNWFGKEPEVRCHARPKFLTALAVTETWPSINESLANVTNCELQQKSRT